MNYLSRTLVLSALLPEVLCAGTVIITSVPDDQHPLAPVTSPAGIPLVVGVELQIGAFPGMSDDQILAAATGGLAQLTASFVSFGAPSAIGDGVDGATGRFEIAAKQGSGSPRALWVGEKISLIIRAQDGGGFLIARFDGEVFEPDPDTGLDPVRSLHLADARIIVGNRYGSTNLATSSAPPVGTFDDWINSYPDIVDPAQRLAAADADGDGRSNFLEYASAGNPISPADPTPCQIQTDDAGGFWVRFSRAAGLGSIRYTVESSSDFISGWQALDGTVEPDPDPPVAGSLNWMRIRVPAPLGSKQFFRLNAASVP